MLNTITRDEIIQNIKRIIRYGIRNAVWLISNWEKLKMDLEEYGMCQLRPYKFLHWNDGFSYYSGCIKSDKVFIKCCSGKYNTIETEARIRDYPDNEHVPKVIFARRGGQYNVVATEFLISDTKGIPCEEYVSQCAEILDYLYENGIVHRDIRPENLVVSKGRVYLLDFGWAIYEENNYAMTKYYQIERMLNEKFRCSMQYFDDAESMYLTIKNTCEIEDVTILSDICKRIGRYQIRSGKEE